MKVITLGEILVEIMRPNLDVPLFKRGEFKGPYPSGAPAIFIYNLASLGHETGIISKVGIDSFGKNCLDHLSKKTIDLHAVRTSTLPTGIAFVTYNSDGSRDFLFHIDNTACGEIEQNDLDEEFIKGFDWLHLNGSSLTINEKVRDLAIAAAKLIKSNGGTLSFDPNIRPELLSDKDMQFIDELLPLCDYVMPSEGEELTITGLNDRTEAIEKLFQTGVKKVFLKLGKEGSILYRPDHSIYARGFKINEVDPTGAGDSYCAGVVCGLIHKWEDEKILKFANAVGAMATQSFGPMELEFNETTVWEFINHHHNKNLMTTTKK
ncbi:sugar kinase [Salipaludibacillus sp. HK11]|uniref:sugar kinase n=1 Tax=Salipaludibacillus sp. HK11 TaxID=3394320 RepID=UPI0039FC04BE